jgi:hypothetical protein
MPAKRRVAKRPSRKATAKHKAVPKHKGSKRTKRAQHVPSELAKQSATRMAERMPLVHFPAKLFEEWSNWGALKSRTELGKSSGTGRFDRLLDDHVFTYAGPCCYTHEGCIGDAVFYFGPAVEIGREGSASPFDSGALQHSPDCAAQLQYFRRRNASEDVRWRFFEKHRVALKSWRKEFADWLASCYNDPLRYIEAIPDRYAAGEPDRINPDYLLKENGTRGRDRHGEEECGDRRTWTWEIRFNSKLEFQHIETLHVPSDSFERVTDFLRDLEQDTGARPTLRYLPKETAVTIDTFYRESGPLLAEMIQR